MLSGKLIGDLHSRRSSPCVHGNPSARLDTTAVGHWATAFTSCSSQVACVPSCSDTRHTWLRPFFTIHPSARKPILARHFNWVTHKSNRPAESFTTEVKLGRCQSALNSLLPLPVVQGTFYPAIDVSLL